MIVVEWEIWKAQLEKVLKCDGVQPARFPTSDAWTYKGCRRPDAVQACVERKSGLAQIAAQ